MRKSLSILTVAVALAVAAGLGCATKPKAIPENLSVAELVQLAQDATDHYNDTRAIACYRAAMDRFGEDESVLCMGEYEIGFIYYKQGKYTEAKDLFTSLTARYEADTEGLLPRRYLILAQKIMPQIEDKLAAEAAKAAKKAK